MLFIFYYTTLVIPASILIPVIFGIIRYKNLTSPLKILFWFLVFSGAANALNIYEVYHAHPTTTLFHIYTIFEFAFISWYYALLFNPKWRKVIFITVSVFTLLCIVNFFYVQNGVQVNTYTGTLEAIIIIAYSVLYLNQQSNIDTETNWQASALNWINISFLIYYGCGLFMFISTNYIITLGENINNIVWAVFDTILLVEYLLFATGFYKCKT